MAKYNQNELAQRVLLATKDAKLVHYVPSRGSKTNAQNNIVFYDTMRIRHRISRGKN